MSTWFEVTAAAVCWVPVSLALACIVGRGLRRGEAFEQVSTPANVLTFPQATVEQTRSIRPQLSAPATRTTSLSG